MENQEIIEKINLKEEYTVDELKDIIELRLYSLIEENRTNRLFGNGHGLFNLRNILSSYLDSYLEQYKLFINENTYDNTYDGDTKFYIVSKEELEDIKIKARIFGDYDIHEDWIEHIKPFTSHKLLEVYSLKLLPIMKSEWNNKQDEIQMIPDVYYKDKLVDKEILYEISKQNSEVNGELAAKRLNILPNVIAEHMEELNDSMKENLITDTVNKIVNNKFSVALNITNKATEIIESLSYGGREAEIINKNSNTKDLAGKSLEVTALQFTAPKPDDVAIDIEMFKEIFKQTKGTDVNYFILMNKQDTNIEHPAKIYVLSDDEIEYALENYRYGTIFDFIKNLEELAEKKLKESK